MGSIYNAVDLNTAYIEMIAGTPGQHLDEYVGIATQQLDPTAEYRFYLCPITNGLPTYQWTDVTDTADYSVVNGVATWNVNPLLNLTMIRSNKNVLSYDLSIPANGGVLEFTLTEATTVNGVAVVRPMQIPLGELDLFLNGYSLIEGIDYIVNFPKIVIVNKAHLVNVLTDQQQITVRFSGFCNTDLSRTLSVDQGFIKYGLLSYNNRFDIRDDKVLRIVVGGKLYTREMLKFSETDSGVTVPNATNGLPYLIRDIVVPLRGMTVDGTYVLRTASTVIDKSISDYMTAYMPEPQVDSANVIITPYIVYSPFCSKILNLLSAGVINDPRLKQQYSDQDVIDICQPYEYLLNSDLSQTSLKQDPNYVEIHPHSADTVINLDLYQYKFITRVVKLYLNDIVDISHFVNITQ
ncbi:MAG: Virion structural protein [uncultured bacterium]|nr:MAG: Virion structural protein [uncultured bacterium]